MPSFNVDGIVTDISLVIVKVKNFDNSVATIPSYSLVTDSFQNWRDLFENGGRRIKRHILIDAGTIRFVDASIREQLKQLNMPEDLLLKSNNLTNLGVFRLYLMHYLRDHPAINKEMSIIARELQPTETGIPVEILAFSTYRDFFEFEMFLSELFEYIYASMNLFDLRVYQRPSFAGSTISPPA
jgi:miniconductance mechanosensitive channel